MGRTKLRSGQLYGMSIGTKHPASTAWIQYNFDNSNERVTIQVYRYSWVVWEKTGSLSRFAKMREEAVEWCKTWKFMFVRERVLQTMSQRIHLKHQDGEFVDPKWARQKAKAV